MRIGALEAGGTKMVCSLGDEKGNVFERVSFKTQKPEDTLPEIISFFQAKEVEALGVGTFGPVELNKNSPAYGSITSTPKPGWRDYPLLAVLKDALHVPIGFDTDVNAAAFAEHKLGAGKGLQNIVYVTVGTGIGGGVVSMGQLVHGLVHPELGHMLLRQDERDPMKDGVCPYHKGCLEGLAAGPSIEKRFGIKAEELPEDHLAWEIETGYLAQMCVNLMMVLSPEKIILGGGVMQQQHLFAPIRARVLTLLNGYVSNEKVISAIDDYIVAPGLGIHSGVIGALLMGADALNCEEAGHA